MIIVFRRRLFWKVYLALLLSLITVAVLVGGLMWLIGEAPREIRVPGRLRLEDLAVPEQDSPAGAIAAALERLAHELGGNVSLYDAHGALIASRGRPIKLATHEADERAHCRRRRRARCVSHHRAAHAAARGVALRGRAMGRRRALDASRRHRRRRGRGGCAHIQRRGRTGRSPV